MSRLLVRGARQLVTLSGPSGPRRGRAMRDVHVVPDGALLIHDGTIEQIGPTRRVEKLVAARHAETIDATGRVVIPAFVDCFTRLLCGPPRLTASGPPDSFPEACRTVRGYSAQRMELEGRKRLRQFLRSGTTTVAGSCGYGLDDLTEVKALRALEKLDNRPIGIVPHFYGAFRCPAEFEDRPSIYLERLATQMLPLIRRRSLARGVIISDQFAPDLAGAYLRVAARLGFSLHVETAAQGLAGALREGSLSVAGLSGIGAEEAAAIAGSSAVAVLLPGQAYSSPDPGAYAPARALIDAGAAVALATGFDHLTSPTMSLPMILSLAATQMGMTTEEVLTAGTCNAAHALGLGATLGSLESGKRGDLLIMNCQDYREVPLYFGMNLVALAIRGGQQVFPRVEETQESPE